MEDPNWFFSTLAQSAAAIVGLIGAFLVSRIVEQANEVREKKKELLGKISNLKTGNIRDKLEWLLDRYYLLITELGVQLNKETISLVDSDSAINISLPKEKIEQIKRHLENGIERFEEKKIFLSSLEVNPEIAFNKEKNFYGTIHEHQEQWKEFITEKYSYSTIYINYFSDVIELEIKIKAVKADYDNYLDSFVLPKYFKYGWNTLAYLAISCVFLPLLFLSAGKYVWAKYPFLALFVFGICILLRFLKHQTDEIENFVKTKF